MANLSLLVQLLVTALCVQGWTHHENQKTKRWRKMEMENEQQLLELREASGDDSDDTDESDESDESEESGDDEGAEIHFCRLF